MVLKDTYDFESKARTRERLEKVIRTIYSKPKDREHLKVLTILGHQDCELKQVWDPLGVPRKNITVVELYPEPHKIIEENNLGINLYPETISILNYITQTQEKFDIINLDAQAQFGLDERNILRNIAGKQLLGNRGILSTWYYGAREDGYNKNWFKKTFEECVNETSEEEGKIKDRSNLISRMICSVFIDGVTNLEPHTSIMENKNLFETYGDFLLQKPEIIETLKKIKKDPEKATLFMGSINAYAGIDFFKARIEKAVSKINGLSEDSKSILSNVLYYQKINSYFSAMQERYKYIGDNKAPMLVDINYFKQEDFSDIAGYNLNDQGEMVINLPIIKDKDERRKRVKRIDLFQKLRHRCTGYDLEKRIHLGSSYVKTLEDEKPTKRILSKEERVEVRDFLATGIPEEEIMQTYNITKEQIAAHKAVVTLEKRKEEAKQQ